MVFLGFFAGILLFGMMILTGLDIVQIPSYVYFIIAALSVSSCSYFTLYFM